MKNMQNLLYFRLFEKKCFLDNRGKSTPWCLAEALPEQLVFVQSGSSMFASTK